MINRRKKHYKKIRLTALLCTAILCAGCGESAVEEEREEVVLIEPPLAEVSFETVIRRDILDADVFTATVCPPSWQYGLESAVTFEAYDVYPGEEIAAGRILLHGNSESIDSSIEKLQESLKEAEESYQTYMEENGQKLEELKKDMEIYEDLLKNLEEQKPANWETEYKKLNKDYENVCQDELELEIAMKQKKELYELDHNYQLSQLEFQKKDKRKLILSAGTGGVIADLRLMSKGDRISGGQNTVAVADLSVKELKSEYISPETIMSADEIYAIVGGVRYDVEYVQMDSAEYTRLKNQNGTVYSTFTFSGDTAGISFGSMGAVVIVHDKAENVLTVSSEAVKRDGSVSYVYVLNGSKREYTAVKTGMKKGLFTEIISGLNEGDKVVKENSLTAGENEQVLELGEVGQSLKLSGNLYYPFSEWVENPVTYGNVYLEEILVQENQQVKKGDVLMTIRVEADGQELEKNRQKLKREQERLEDLKAAGEAQNEKAIKTKEETVEKLKELVSQMESDYAAKEIRSDVSGIIIQLTSLKAGDEIRSQEKLFLIADESRSLIKVDDDKNQLAFGQEVSISYTLTSGEKKTMTGRVTTLNPVGADKTLTDKTALIQVTDDEMREMTGSTLAVSGRWRLTYYEVTAETEYMDHVVLVPKSAVKTADGCTYVKVKLDDGEVVYQSFIAGGSDFVNYWVADGLTEGMRICLE